MDKTKESNIFILFFWLLGCISVSFFVSYRGFKKKSLSLSGFISGFILGTITFFAGVNWAVVMLFFYFSGSYWTKWRQNEKKHLEDDFKEGGQRTLVQVLSNGGIATFMVILYLYYFGFSVPVIGIWRSPLQNFLIFAFIGAYSCCCGDTWASEIGILSPSKPILITTLQQVPKGTNGAISMIGTLASAVGGLCCGLVFYISVILSTSTNIHQWPIIAIAGFSGLLGSLIDSLLGATLQYSGYSETKTKIVSTPDSSTRHISGINILDNHQVNFLSSVICSLIIGYTGMKLFH